MKPHPHKADHKGHLATQVLKKIEKEPVAPKRDMAQELIDLSVEVRGAGHSAPFEVPLTRAGAETILEKLNIGVALKPERE